MMGMEELEKYLGPIGTEMRQLIEEAKKAARAKETKWSVSKANVSMLDAQY